MVESERENFLDHMEQINREHFENNIPSVRDIEDEKEEINEEEYEKPLDPEIKNNEKEEVTDENTIINTQIENNSQKENKKKPEVCQKKGAKGEGCLFGCPDEDEDEDKEPIKMDLNQMMMTIEDTEKICDMIEEKDRIRKEKEDREALKKQVELNRKFLIQQKAQNKQIKDLEELVKSMSFTHEMNKTAVEKCGQNADECLSEKERKLKQMLIDKQKQAKNVKVNLNFKDFGKQFLQHLTQKLGLNNDELTKLLNAINNGSLDLLQVQNQLGFNNTNLITNSNNSNSDSNNTNYLNDMECPKCEVDLSEYIDRCKIPCHKCRDPKWKCPQDIQN